MQNTTNVTDPSRAVGEHLLTKRLFFEAIALRHLPELRILLLGGQLWKRAGWRSVVEHSLIQVAVFEELAKLIDLPETELQQHTRVAAVHDWDKRIEIRPEEFTAEEVERGEMMLAALDVNQFLIAATKPEFLKRALVDRMSTFSERLQFYIDDICTAGDIVPWQERIEDLIRRKPELNDDPKLTRELGGPYWEREKELCALVEAEIHLKLPANFAPEEPEQLPTFLRKMLEMRIQSS